MQTEIQLILNISYMSGVQSLPTTFHLMIKTQVVSDENKICYWIYRGSRYKIYWVVGNADLDTKPAGYSATF